MNQLVRIPFFFNVRARESIVDVNMISGISESIRADRFISRFISIAAPGATHQERLKFDIVEWRMSDPLCNDAHMVSFDFGISREK